MPPEMQSFYTPNTAATHLSHAPAAVDELISKYSSATAPAVFRKPGHRNPVQRFSDRVRLEYYRYEVTFGLYVLTPNEKVVANSFVVVSLLLLFWALFIYFPPLLFHKICRLGWLLTGHSSQEVSSVVRGFLDAPGTPMTPVSIAENAFPS
ncbi:Uncharacterized protein PECH_005444 [Penicillium ucsense]|uniref:Uncharacterized protein n=2 Tax=Penicillium TaxID=5073 RepID=A0A8J8WHK8_9EURO|nr:uncharacterized protein N7539_003581 [Penicillium diatomitis]KAF7716168.1 Uncharacterized protein PECM_005982 [Penicillium ucsense]KAF7736343.1 Uncharacterized protein PECH_005444 [Penicillium ucsense]KAJ5488691.1 hypothetical protein N7539_003581 [Penicillium diatomitis]